MKLTIKDFVQKQKIKPTKVEIKGKVTIITTKQGTYCLKRKDPTRSSPSELHIYEYLNSRSFYYYPKVLELSDDEIEVREYIREDHLPREQKMVDLIDLMSLLHNKTTHYKEVDLDDYKKIYEDLRNNIIYLTSYYNDLISVIDESMIMSPKEYLLARNCSMIFKSLYFCEVELEHWYEMIKEKRKQRVVVLHNNLQLGHFLRNENSYFINWEKAKIGIPIFDFYKLYRAHALEFDFQELLRRYEHRYPLKKEERLLLFIMISMPEKIEFNDSEMKCCEMISHRIDELYKAKDLRSPYQAEKTKQH